MYEFVAVSIGLFLLAIASDLGGPDPVMKTELVSKPLIVVQLR